MLRTRASQPISSHVVAASLLLATCGFALDAHAAPAAQTAACNGGSAAPGFCAQVQAAIEAGQSPRMPCELGPPGRRPWIIIYGEQDVFERTARDLAAQGAADGTYEIAVTTSTPGGATDFAPDAADHVDGVDDPVRLQLGRTPVILGALQRWANQGELDFDTQLVLADFYYQFRTPVAQRAWLRTRSRFANPDERAFAALIDESIAAAPAQDPFNWTQANEARTARFSAQTQTRVERAFATALAEEVARDPRVSALLLQRYRQLLAEPLNQALGQQFRADVEAWAPKLWADGIGARMCAAAAQGRDLWVHTRAGYVGPLVTAMRARLGADTPLIAIDEALATRERKTYTERVVAFLNTQGVDLEVPSGPQTPGVFAIEMLGLDRYEPFVGSETDLSDRTDAVAAHLAPFIEKDGLSIAITKQRGKPDRILITDPRIVKAWTAVQSRRAKLLVR